jgi:hypothetical protein
MTRGRRIFVRLLIALALAPFVALLTSAIPNRTLNFLSRSKLSGATETVELVSPQWDKIRNHSFQSSAEEWVAQRMGRPRDHFIRVDNSIAYAFGTSNVEMVQIGINRTLHEKPYVDEWCGRTYVNVAPQVDHIASIQRKVEAAGKTFVLLISPSKAAIYPETLPPPCKASAEPRAYDRLLPLLKARGIHTVDGHALMKRLRDEQPWVVFGRDGVHWNDVGAGAAVDAVLASLTERMPRPLPRLVQTGVKVDDKPMNDDADLAGLLNLTYRLRALTPHPSFRVDGAAPPPKLMLVGTSFNWQPLRVMRDNGLIVDNTLLYYFKSSARFIGNKQYDLEPNNAAQVLPEVFARSEAVVLEINEALPLQDYVGQLDAALSGLSH